MTRHETKPKATKYHERDFKSGQYRKGPDCDICGKPTGLDYATDDEVCGGSDGPGFTLCSRKRCPDLSGLPVEERLAWYTRVREQNDARNHAAWLVAKAKNEAKGT